jgi:site-specific DNA recombinase
MRLIIYIRVSTEEQAREGFSLAAQRARAEAFCTAFGHQVVEVIPDAGVSAKSLKRPGLQCALKMLRKGEADGILVAKLDRLSRSLIDFSKLIEKYFNERSGRHLLSMSESIDTTSAGGRLVLNVLMAVAQWEREAIAERTSAGLREKKRQGAQLGAVPLGFKRIGDRVVEDAGEQLVVKRARELAAGGAGLGAIAAALSAEGHKTKRGGKWHITTVRKLLARIPAAAAVVLLIIQVSIQSSWVESAQRWLGPSPGAR